MSTLSSDHALSELASMHETVAQERARQRPFEAEEQNPAPGPTERNARWHRFVQARIAGRPKPPSFQELSEEWHAMTEEALGLVRVCVAGGAVLSRPWASGSVFPLSNIIFLDLSMYLSSLFLLCC